MTVATRGSTSLQGSSLATTASTVGWGLYCAASWTWCIGMFMPIILLSRFGWAGFWTFLIPNVIGCVAFGYIFDRESSRRFATDHAVAIRWFAAATIACHVCATVSSSSNSQVALPRASRWRWSAP